MDCDRLSTATNFKLIHYHLSRTREQKACNIRFHDTNDDTKIYRCQNWGQIAGKIPA